MAPHPESADEQLAFSTSQGDRDAFAELYGRHFPGVYDLVYRMVRDQDVAADIAQNTFIRAWESLQRRRVSGNVRAWLLTIARNTAINEIKRRKRWRSLTAGGPEGREPLELEVVDTSRISNPEAVVDDRELVDLVWTSAAALGPKDYSLLDMHLRQDLSAGEMAASLGLSSARVHVMLSRLRDSLEESVSVALLVRRGRRDCSALSDILDGAARDFSRDTRLEVRRHLKECELCAESSRRFVAPAEIFSGLALVPVSDDLIFAMWSRISPLLVPAGGSLAFLWAGVDRVGNWWVGAGSGVKAASIAALATVVVLPLGVSLLVVTAGGAEDSAGPTDPTNDVHLDSSPGRAPQATAMQRETDNSPVPMPLVAGVAASPAATEGPGSEPPPAAGETPAPTTVAPTAAPATPAPSPSQPPPPQPTPTPPATNLADVSVVNVVLTSSGGTAGQQFLLSASALLRNLGGAPSVLADVGFALTAPAGCTFSPATPVTVQDRTLPLGSDVSVTRTWSITCSSAGDNSFSVAASAALDLSQPLTDPNLGNNANSGTLVVSVAP